MTLPTINASIIFVDDVEPNVQLGKKILELVGCQVEGFTDSRLALERFSENINGYDLLITDQIMPFMTGFELAEKIIALRADLPIIMVSGNDEEIDENQAQEFGISMFLPKPLHVESLIASVHSALLKNNSSQTEEEESLTTPDNNSSLEPGKPADLADIKQYLSETYKMEPSSIEIIMAGAGKSLIEQLDKIKDAIQQTDYDSLATGFHTIKGILLNLGLSDLANTALLAEKSAKKMINYDYTSSYETILQGVQQIINL